jgi:hypothetical protein
VPRLCPERRERPADPARSDDADLERARFRGLPFPARTDSWT